MGLPIRVFWSVQILGAVLAFWFVPVRSLIGFMGTLLCRPCFANPVWRTLFGFWRSIMFYFCFYVFSMFLKGAGWGIREVLSLFFYVFLCFSMFYVFLCFSLFFSMFFLCVLCFSMFFFVFYVFLCFFYVFLCFSMFLVRLKA